MRASIWTPFTEPPATQTQNLDQIDHNLSWGFGAGLDIIMHRDMTVFLEGKYTIVFTQDAGPRYLPIRLGVLF